MPKAPTYRPAQIIIRDPQHTGSNRATTLQGGLSVVRQHAAEPTIIAVWKVPFHPGIASLSRDSAELRAVYARQKRAATLAMSGTSITHIITMVRQANSPLEIGLAIQPILGFIESNAL